MNNNHDSRGRFASGSAGSAATGDHMAASPSPNVRNVNGRAVPRSQTVTRHAVPTVGTEPVRLDNSNSPARKGRLGSARSDAIVRMKATDTRHFGIPGDMHARMNAATLAGPTGSITSSPGRFNARSMKIK